MRANFGEHFKLTIFGESHGAAIGIVIDGLPAGAAIDEESIARQMARRAPGNRPQPRERKRTLFAYSPACATDAQRAHRCAR